VQRARRYTAANGVSLSEVLFTERQPTRYLYSNRVDISRRSEQLIAR
jgi:hypothetical protein